MKKRINVLKEGDTVLNVTENMFCIRHKNGEVELFQIIEDEQAGLLVDVKNSITIGYGDGTIETFVDADTMLITY